MVEALAADPVNAWPPLGPNREVFRQVCQSMGWRISSEVCGRFVVEVPESK